MLDKSLIYISFLSQSLLGAVEINVPSPASAGDSVLRNEVADELTAQFGVSPQSLADHVMMCMPEGAMSGIAYASLPGWRSVYKNNWCTYLSTQVSDVHMLSCPIIYIQLTTAFSTEYTFRCTNLVITLD